MVAEQKSFCILGAAVLALRFLHLGYSPFRKSAHLVFCRQVNFLWALCCLGV